MSELLALAEKATKVSVPPATLPNFTIDLEYIDELKLKPYDFQIIGINFLTQVKKCLLGDEMGLGKTPQAIGAAYKLYKEGKASKALVLCPASLKYQWGNEIEKFTDLSYTIIDGTPKQRKQLYQNDTFFVIANYELLLRDLEDIQSIYPDIIIADECHRIRNHKSKTSKAILKLDAPYKWGLTGTPLQNSPDEIFNVFAFLDPSILGNYWAFRKRYIRVGNAYGKKNVPLGPQNLDELHARLAPYMLRRLKVDVAKDLPEIIYKTLLIDMTKDQKQLHEIVFNDFKELMDRVESLVERDEYGDIIKKPPEADRALAYFVIMQEIADSLELLSMSDSALSRGYDIKSKDSPKLDELYEICKERVTNNPKSKTVIFTQFERMQQLIYKRLSPLGGCAIINGSTPNKKKQEEIDRFINDDSIRFFLSTDSGNYGINLGVADCLISVDIPWNPAVWLQRNARIHRINSTHDRVEVITMISRGSIDEIIYRTMYRKMETSAKVIEYTQEEKEQLEKLTIKKLKEILASH